MSKNHAAFISLAVVCSGSFVLSTQSVQAKNSKNTSHASRDFFVPPPPPYTPSLVTLSMMNAQAATTTSNKVETTQAAQPNPYLLYNPVVETKVQKHIDSIDSEISSIQKDIGKLLNL